MGVRMQRVSRLLQREIADIIAREVEESQMITVTEARVTRDLSIVNVFVSVFGETPEQRHLCFKQLTRQTARVRGSLGRRIRHQFRAIPQIRFNLDDTPETVRKIDALFEQIQSERQNRSES